MFKLFGIVLPQKESGEIRIGRDICKVIFRIGKWHLLYRITNNGITY